MSESFAQRIAQLDSYVKQLHGLAPEPVAAYGALSKKAQIPGALDGKTKELIALAISVATRCEGCIAYHARGAVRTGATRQEVAEMLGVTLQMGGGPAMVHAADALRAYDEFADAAVKG
ncbi:MAG: carboxymuconolactone decarboxylase family protein [Hyphomonadaceae bacterium]